MAKAKKVKSKTVFMVVNEEGRATQKVAYATRETADMAAGFSKLLQERGDSNEFYVKEIPVVDCAPEKLLQELRKFNEGT